MRLRGGEWIAGAGGVALLVSLFLDWYARSGSGWASFAVVDVLLALLALVPLALVCLQATRRSPALPAAFSVLTAVAGQVALLLVLWRLVDAPGDAGGVRGGAWLGLVATVLVVVGGWRSMRVERMPGAAMPAIELLPAPPP